VRGCVAAFFPRRHIASLRSADMSAHSKRSARRLAQKLLVRPARAEGDPSREIIAHMRFGQGDVTARERSITTQRKQALGSGWPSIFTYFGHC
jgi:hypothetical protein